ncbi:MAG: tRNA 2-selenouridine(34) synthase MnmH [Bacteroidales bacterium]|nr:tRNA 2-selenouridine(34) synthase MnmH [Bacteroidales bacterium]
MPRILNPKEFLSFSNQWPVIDVRSPGEYAIGHISGAFNLPLFTDDERAIIGTLYAKQGKDPAVKQGMEIVGLKFGSFISEIEKITTAKQIGIHCWRGGMRSESLAWFYEKLGYEVFLLEGGYKAYRKFIRSSFKTSPGIFLLGGMTGSGKTEILGELEKIGEQTIDLEGMAHHKGSSFGHLGQSVQPSTEQFENDLYVCWAQKNNQQPLWIEHESHKVGTVYLPDTFRASMQNGTLIRLILPLEIRVSRLMNEYSHFDKSLLKESILHICQGMGTYQNKLALEALESGKLSEVAEIVLQYYDKTYEFALKKRPFKKVFEIRLDSPDMKMNARKILDFTKSQMNIHERRS